MNMPGNKNGGLFPIFVFFVTAHMIYWMQYFSVYMHMYMYVCKN